MFSELTTTSSLAAFVLAATFLYHRYGCSHRHIRNDEERVLVIGGSSGIGRAITHIYSKRGAKVCIVGRQEYALEKAHAECVAARSPGAEHTVISVRADFADARDMVRVRQVLEQAWGGVDTVVVSAGVSALRPLLEVAEVNNNEDQATEDGIQRTIDVSNAAVRGNYTGPLVSAVTFIPLLLRTSASPSILLISSLAALIPAPTRSLYGSTKSASLLLYRALAIEHPQIKFTAAIPATVEGNFRASAVDQGPVRESEPNKHGLKTEYVAKKCVRAVDNRQETVLLPYWYGKLGYLLYIFIPSATEWFAKRKYNA
ncbi:NAD-P-binding protein [Cytidiella melzeri]|nr:NAD-P-binding protein [Cytidiella melzeri]